MRAFICAAAFVWATASAQAGERVALAIGNTQYSHTTRLPNAATDAQRIGQILKSAGFQSAQIETNLNFDAMRKALLAFRERAQKADVALIFYAGHGIQAGGENYLIPIDAKLAREADASLEAFSLNGILDGIAPASGPVKSAASDPFRVVILDACRTNTFSLLPPGGATRGKPRGFAPVGKRRNTVIAFSTAPNFVADDGDGEHSPYAEALFKYVATPGMDVRKVFGFIYDDTMERTRNEQEPDLTVKLGGRDYFLVEGSRIAAALPAATKQSTESFLVYFDFDKTNIRPEGLGIVESAAKFAIGHKVKTVKVAGHTDGRSFDSPTGQASPLYSQKLSERMASNVAAALVAQGVDGSVISIEGFGATKPRVPPGSEVSAAMNRRVEIQVVY